MELQKQVCSLESAKRLKDLGVNQESLFWWVRRGHYFCGNVEYQADAPFVTDEREHDFPYEALASAFTVAELGMMLPTGLWYEKTKQDNRFRVGHIKELTGGVSPSHVEWGDTEADARTKMLIYLLENKLI